MLLLINSVVFAFLFTIWSRASWVNLLLKFTFLVLGVVNLLVFFKVI